VTDFIVIAGMSGAGRTTAANTFEDLGWFYVDNLPPPLIGKIAELAQAPGSAIERIALVVGTSASVDDLSDALEQLRSRGARVRILFLDASDEALVRRYESTRRRHPLTESERVTEGIEKERTLLEPIKAEADVVIDTSDLNVHQLHDRLVELFAGDDPTRGLQTSVVSFGYKHGLPLDVDLVFDCRFLPNPHWVDELRAHSGLEKPVRRYVMNQPETKEFLEKLDDLFGLLLPAYIKEGKSYLSIAVGCTGGRHRAVVLAEEVARMLRGKGFKPIVHHRDIDR
jgi:RNase adapter protein RapZ